MRPLGFVVAGGTCDIGLKPNWDLSAQAYIGITRKNCQYVLGSNNQLYLILDIPRILAV